MAERPFDLAIYGGGFSARLLAAAIAGSGKSILLLEPAIDPDALPRPFPDPGAVPWRGFWRHTLPTAADAGEWVRYGGLLRDPFARRRLAAPDAAASLAPAAGGWAEEATEPNGAWAEPADGYPALWRRLGRRLEQLAVERRPWPRPLALTGGLVRRARLAGLSDPVRALLILRPDRASGLRQAPGSHPVVPAHGTEDGVRWWRDGAGSVLWLHGWDGTWAGAANGVGAGRLPAAPPGIEAGLAPTARFAGPPPWGVVTSRGCTVVSVPGPARFGPGGWAGWLLATARPWLGRQGAAALAK